MVEFFIYMLKTSLCLALFYLFYKVLLSKETFHKINRVALILIIIFSFCIPIIQLWGTFPYEENVLSIEKHISLETILLESSEVDYEDSQIIGYQTILNRAYLFVIFYFAGILFFFFRAIYSFTRIFLLMRNSRIEKLEKNIKLVIHNRQIVPFSCLQLIVLSEADLKENGREIICHEKSHIQKFHAFDLFLSEICLLLQWFNPAAWLIRQEIKTVHEYQADNAVIHSGIEAKSYQLLLIKRTVGAIQFHLMTNSFYHGKLKKRITMMLKEKSSPWAYLKFSFILLVAVISMTVFAQPEIKTQLEEISEVKVNNLPEMQEVIKKSFTVLKRNSENNAIEVYKDGVKVDDHSYTVISNDAKPTYLSDATYFKLTKDGQMLDAEGNFVENVQKYAVGSKTLNAQSKNNLNIDNVEIILINGEVKPVEDFHKLNPAEIKSVGLSLGDYSKLYGEDAKEGILRITTK